MADNRFNAGAPEPQSLVKIAIVEKYFAAWSTIITRHTDGPICYADFYAGEGKYGDGTPSIPLRVLRTALDDVQLRPRLVTVFNDRKTAVADMLARNIHALEGIELLGHEPIVLNCEVGRDNAALLRALPVRTPTLTLLDPTGYKGLSVELIDTLTTGFGCECIMFFNMNRITGAIPNPGVEGLMRQLFGEEWFPIVSERVGPLEKLDRELAILQTMTEALQAHGMHYVLPFRFRDARGTRTSHHLVHVCRHIRGHQTMKDIMARESSSDSQGVASFEYNPADERYPVLFEYARPLDELKALLLDSFAGQTVTFEQIYKTHHVGSYVRPNYREAILELEQAGAVACSPPSEERQKRKGTPTCGPNTIVTFPD